MKQIQCAKGKIAIVDDDRYEELNTIEWGIARVYAYNDRAGLMHHLILNPPIGFVVNHKDDNPLNNQRENLEIVTQAINIQKGKLRKDNISGYKGVNFCYKNGKPWRAAIAFERKNIHLGYFNTAIEAAIKYNEAALKYYGSTAFFNKL